MRTKKKQMDLNCILHLTSLVALASYLHVLAPVFSSTKWGNIVEDYYLQSAEIIPGTR